MSVRLNKLLAQRGLGARRKCDALIQQGAVMVNGRVVREPGTQVEPGRDRITVNGRPLPGAAALRYYALHKPVGVITTLHDPEGRRTIAEMLPAGPRVYPVGRLDADTSGLIVLTNDGELAHRLMHPRYGVEKVYRVRLDRAPGPGQLERLQRGVEFEPGVRSAPARARVLDATPGGALLSLALHEGRYRQVRRMCEAVGLAVLGLHRSAYGPLRLGELARGMWRELSEAEVAALRAASARPNTRPRGHHSGVARRVRPAPAPAQPPRRERFGDRPRGPRARPAADDARAGARPGRGAGEGRRPAAPRERRRPRAAESGARRESAAPRARGEAAPPRARRKPLGPSPARAAFGLPAAPRPFEPGPPRDRPRGRPKPPPRRPRRDGAPESPPRAGAARGRATPERRKGRFGIPRRKPQNPRGSGAGGAGAGGRGGPRGRGRRPR